MMPVVMAMKGMMVGVVTGGDDRGEDNGGNDGDEGVLVIIRVVMIVNAGGYGDVGGISDGGDN